MDTTESASSAPPTADLGLVLSGGGARGMFQVGVWDVLRNDPRGLPGPPEIISGTSAGALNAALIAAGKTPDQMKDFWLELGASPPVQGAPSFFRSALCALGKLIAMEPFRPWALRVRACRILAEILRTQPWFLPSGALASILQFVLTARFDSVSQLLEDIYVTFLFTTAAFKERLRDFIGGDQVPAGLRLAVNCMDVHGGNVIRFVNYDVGSRKGYVVVPAITVDMVVASSSIPLLFKSIAIGDYDLWDGGLLVNTPIAPAVPLGANSILPVLVNALPTDVPRSDISFGRASEKVFDALLENMYNTDRKLLLQMNKVHALDTEERMGVKHLKLYEAIRPPTADAFPPGSFLFFEPEVMTGMYKAGQQAAKTFLDEGWPTDPGYLTEAEI